MQVRNSEHLYPALARARTGWRSCSLSFALTLCLRQFGMQKSQSQRQSNSILFFFFSFSPVLLLQSTKRHPSLLTAPLFTALDACNLLQEKQWICQARKFIFFYPKGQKGRCVHLCILRKRLLF